MRQDDAGSACKNSMPARWAIAILAALALVANAGCKNTNFLSTRDEVHIGTIAVLPEFRRQGIALSLITKVLIEANSFGAVQGMLEVRRGNIAAQELYRRLGFVVVGVRPRYYRDNQEDALLMTLPRIDPVELQSFL